MKRIKFLKVCSCGKMVFSDAPYPGLQEGAKLYDFHLYNCTNCKSTVAVKKLRERQLAKAKHE